MGSNQNNPHHPMEGRDYLVHLVCLVAVLSTLTGVAAGFIAFLMPVPWPAPVERLFETLLSLSTAGFFAIITMLAAHHIR